MWGIPNFGGVGGRWAGRDLYQLKARLRLPNKKFCSISRRLAELQYQIIASPLNRPPPCDGLEWIKGVKNGTN